MSRLHVATVVALLLAAAMPVTTAYAQVQSRPTEAPLVTAESEAWYAAGEPVPFAGDVYYRAGAMVFFNGNTMVRSGYFNGVPLYSDATLEPYSLIYVPLSRGRMQPYERLRRGELAGTTGSRTPSFPVALVPDQRAFPMAGAAPTSVGPAGNALAPESGAVATAGTIPRPGETSAPTATTPVIWLPSPPEMTLRRAESNDGIWLEYSGARWVSAGRAVAWNADAFQRIGEHAGFPVYAMRSGPEDVIFLSTRPGVVAPFRRK